MPAYHRPSTLADALDILASDPVTLAAGCTDLYPATQAKALPGDILDITAIPDLQGISQDDAGWRIGAAVTWAEIIRHHMPPAFDGLKRAAREVGSVQIQTAGTVAGNLCTASPAGDGAPCLMTLDAEVELMSATGTRSLPLAAFLTGARRTARRDDELVSAIRIPARAASGEGDFLKLGARRYLVISIAMAAARFETKDGAITRAALSVGACSPTAVRLTELEKALGGAPLATAAKLVSPATVAPHLSPIDDIRGDAGYRSEAATELVRRLILRCAEKRAEVAA